MSWVIDLWRWLPRPLRMIVSGGVSTVADTVVLLALCWSASVPAGIAAAAGCVCGGAVNFAITRAWIFRVSDAGWARQALRYGVIVVGGGAVVSGLAVAAAVAAGLPVLVAKAVAVVVALCAWTYPMSARVVFAPAPPATAPFSRCGEGPVRSPLRAHP